MRFAWGTTYFDGFLESMEESLGLFSRDGCPLRGRVAVELVGHGISDPI